MPRGLSGVTRSAAGDATRRAQATLGASSRSGKHSRPLGSRTLRTGRSRRRLSKRAQGARKKSMLGALSSMAPRRVT